MLMTLRRLESTFIQREMGFIRAELTGGSERSVLFVIASGGGAQWWQNVKPAFSPAFVEYIDEQLASSRFAQVHPSVGGSEETR